MMMRLTCAAADSDNVSIKRVVVETGTIVPGLSRWAGVPHELKIVWCSRFSSSTAAEVTTLAS